MQQAAVPKIAEITLALRELARLRHLRRPIRERLARLVRIRQQLLLTLHSLPLLLVRDGSAHEQAGRDQPAADELDWRGDLAEGARANGSVATGWAAHHKVKTDGNMYAAEKLMRKYVKAEPRRPQ